MIANLINPWPMTFMVAFLPQFVDPARGSVTLQLLLLGGTQKITGVLVLGAYAIASGTVGEWVLKQPKIRLWQQRTPAVLSLAWAFAWPLVAERPVSQPPRLSHPSCLPCR